MIMEGHAHVYVRSSPSVAMTDRPSLLSHSVSLMAKMAGYAGLRLCVAVMLIHADATKFRPLRGSRRSSIHHSALINSDASFQRYRVHMIPVEGHASAWPLQAYHSRRHVSTTMYAKENLSPTNHPSSFSSLSLEASHTGHEQSRMGT